MIKPALVREVFFSSLLIGDFQAPLYTFDTALTIKSVRMRGKLFSSRTQSLANAEPLVRKPIYVIIGRAAGEP